MSIIIEDYLKYVTEGNSYNDPSMPNPYDYQSLELDEKVTKNDLNILGKWLLKNKKFLNPKDPIEPYDWLYSETNKNKIFKPKTIIDKNKRVGIVFLTDSYQLKWASWIPGYRYAARGIMKLIDESIKIDKSIIKVIKRSNVDTSIYHKNIPSLKTALILKMKIRKINDEYWCDLQYPIWWIEKKKGIIF